MDLWGSGDLKSLGSPDCVVGGEVPAPVAVVCVEADGALLRGGKRCLMLLGCLGTGASSSSVAALLLSSWLGSQLIYLETLPFPDIEPFKSPSLYSPDPPCSIAILDPNSP